MKFSLVFVGSALAAAQFVAAQGNIIVSTLDSLRTCAANRLSWSGGMAPYNVYIIAPNTPGTTYDTLGQTSDNFFVSTPTGSVPNVAVGDTVAVYVTDASGLQGGSAGIKIVQGPSATCAGSGSGGSSSAASSSAASSSAASSSAASSSAAAPTTTSAAASSSTTNAPRPSSSTSTTSSAPASTTSKAGAAPTGKSYAAFVAGAVGVAAAALL